MEKTDAGRDWVQEEKGKIEDEMAGWHHRLDGCEAEWPPPPRDEESAGPSGLGCQAANPRKVREGLLEVGSEVLLLLSPLSKVDLPPQASMGEEGRVREEGGGGSARDRE